MLGVKGNDPLIDSYAEQGRPETKQFLGYLIVDLAHLLLLLAVFQFCHETTFENRISYNHIDNNCYYT
ncbi:hypothetical protein D3C86_2199930 [compost metagenome]